MTEPFHIKTNSAIHRHGHNMNLPFVCHGVKQKFVKRSSIRETLVLPENRHRKMF